ncbi:aromatic-amino-acid aminotransferase [Bordetella pertussis]|nr:aromatic-amino-acid aminotransferase [Bordetella pertussis]
MSTLFASVELAPRDPILGLNEQYNADTRPGKVNLGVGVYYDDEGRIPLLQAVRKAEVARIEAAAARGYLPIEGIAGYNKGAQALLLGADSPLAAEGRVLTAQALGGTGALKIGADFLRQLLPQSKVLISDPSWENHRALFERAGFPVETYAYYDAATHGLNFEAMLAALQAAPEQTIVVLHACCHNPTGVDPTPQQWEQIAAVVKARNLVPFLDIAYQGFGEGLEQDAAVVRMFAELDLTMFISSSFSKSFSLYGERVGALTVVAGSKDEAARVLSQLKRVIRTNYSNPPTHGGTVVSTVLNTPSCSRSGKMNWPACATASA